MADTSAAPSEPAGDVLRVVTRRILADIRRGLSGKRDITLRIHGVRVALKRCDAMARVLVGVLPSPHAEAVERSRRQSRSFARRFAPARDLQAAADALADLRSDTTRLPRSVTAAIEKRLARLRHAAERPAALDDAARRLARWIDRTERAVESWPLEGVAAGGLAAGLAAGYRRARRRVPRPFSAASATELHRLRQRVIRHIYQLELLVPGFDAGRHRDLNRLRRRLGKDHDLQVLADMTRRGRPLAAWRAQLAPPIAMRREKHRSAIRKLCKPLFARPARAFQRDVAAHRRAP